MSDKACSICGGTAGQLPPSGAHHLCEARKKLGVPTPSLGDKCPTCGGAGHTTKVKTGVGVALPADLSQKEMDRLFPKCETCGGTGAVGRQPDPEPTGHFRRLKGDRLVFVRASKKKLGR